MTFRNPKDVRAAFRDHSRRALILTTVEHESRAVKAHLTEAEVLIGEKDALYEYGRFPDPAGDWLIVHAITQQGNSDAGLVAAKAHQEFGSFDVQMFVGVAGSLKDDIPIGSVVVGDYVHNGHSAKVADNEILGRPHSLAAARELLTAARGVIHIGDWASLIRAPSGMELPPPSEYPCDFPPLAFIKGIVSGEEVVAGDKSQRYAWIRLHMNDCGAVEMEGWGVMNAGHHENASSIIVRGISDMCAGKDHASDRLHQPLAAAHAAAFAFAILSFRSKVPATRGAAPQTPPLAPAAAESTATAEKRVEFILNFQGSTDEWSPDRIEAVVSRLKSALADDKLELVRIEVGSVRLVVKMREADAQRLDIGSLREATSEVGATLLGAAFPSSVDEAEAARIALADASADLLSWEKTLPNGDWIERPEQLAIAERLKLPSSTTVLLGDPGSGKSALLSKIASQLVAQREAVFAIKADFLSQNVTSEEDLQSNLQLLAKPSDLILRLSVLRPVYLLIDQLDALASQLDLKSGRLNVLLNLVKRVGTAPNVHILMSARTFEFNHDVRLRTIDAESLSLTLPAWHEVKKRLTEVGIDAEDWPESAQEVVRIPQALKTFMSLANAGSPQPFVTYQAMLEQLWIDRIATSPQGAGLVSLASDLAAKMAEEEVLWLAASRFDERLSLLKRLEALGFVVRSDNGLSVAFSHQTIFDYILARTFVRDSGLLSSYVIERQDSLFVRSKIWSALNYLRGAETDSYEREFAAIWEHKDLPRHLRLLLIEFLGQVVGSSPFEKSVMSEVLNSDAFRVFGLKSIRPGTDWFSHFAFTSIRNAMLGTEGEAAQAGRVLAQSWKADSQRVLQLIRDCWIRDSRRDLNTWWVLQDCPHWTADVEGIAATLLKRTPVSPWHVEHLATAIAVEQPEVAHRLVRAKLDFSLAQAMSAPLQSTPSFANEDDEITWRVSHDATRELVALLEATEWGDLPTLAQANPSSFINELWPWYLKVFAAIMERKGREPIAYLYPGRYVLEIDTTAAEQTESRREKPVINAIETAVEELARAASRAFADWSCENSKQAVMVVQQLLARGFTVSADSLSSEALDWLLADIRRFQLGDAHGHRWDSVGLVQACAAKWSDAEVARFEQSVLSYRPAVPSHLEKPEQRKIFADMIRATKKDLLHAVGVERLTASSRELVATEGRALGDRFDRSFSEVKGGWIGPPMDSTAMERAKDRDILRILREIPDRTGWNHPTDWMRGGNIQLSRAFAEFARANPARAMRLIEQFEPEEQERPAGYALDALAETEANDTIVLNGLFDLSSRGFRTPEFRDSASRAIEKIAQRRDDLGDDVVELLVGWLRDAAVDHTPDEAAEETSTPEQNGSILWGYGNIAALPGGSFVPLSALASILLGREEVGRNQYIAILDDHLARDTSSSLWKALLRTLNHAGGITPQVVSTFVRKLFSEVLGLSGTSEAVMFLAHAQRWDDELVLELIKDWPTSEAAFLRQAYGELVGLVSIVRDTPTWGKVRSDIIASDLEEPRVGLAHAAANLWANMDFRERAGRVTGDLLSQPSKEVVAAAVDVFRLTDEFVPDASTKQLLVALLQPQVDISGASSTFIVDRLQDLLPYEAELVSAIAMKLVTTWRTELGDIRTGTSAAAPQLTDLALTLHRLGGPSRSAGVRIFEEMIEIDAYGARDTLLEIDGRFDRRSSVTRQRLVRRRNTRGTRRR